jgi:hypothetical protein
MDRPMPQPHLSTCPAAVSLYAECNCGVSRNRTEAAVRLARLKDDLRNEGASEATVARLATPEHAARMAKYETRAFDLIAGMFK